MTTHGDAIYKHGGVPLGGGMLPVMGYKSRAFFVHGSSGVDGGNRGTSPKKPLKTLTAAYGKCASGRGDVVYILNDGTTGATVRDVALDWAKNNTHIVGLCAPAINNRARISTISASTDVDAYTPYLTLSAAGCIIKNVSWFQGNSENGKASVGMLVSGLRNYIENVSVITGAHINQGDETSVNVQITGEENVFQSCYIGQDTAARSNVASANVRFGTGSAEEATRNIFRDCTFPMYADGAGPLFINAPSTADVQRWNLFERCNFLNTGTSTTTAGVVWAADCGGLLFLKDCAFYGTTDVTAADNALVLQSTVAFSATPADMGKYMGVDVA
jgi:hypothetical protein